MTEACEHWLVQRRVNDPYWACVDCELEFRPVEPPRETARDLAGRTPRRTGLAEP